MAILVLNAGSSSLKYTLFDTELNVIVKGLLEELEEYNSAFDRVLLHVKEHIEDSSRLKAIVHRVVHGGEFFNAPTVIDEKVIEKIQSLIPLAPLHNRANVEGIKASIQQLPSVLQVAVFDTAFHQSMPEYIYRYALPSEWYEDVHVRRYGFHGTSHEYIASQASTMLDIPLNHLHVISFHIGNGVSACAISYGKSMDTSMGMTPLEGLMMGTRSGSIDPAIIFYLMKAYDMDADEVEKMLNKKSGMLAIAGSSDIRSVQAKHEKGDNSATLALDMYIYRLKKQLGAYMASMPKVDAIVFTGGVGENSLYIREKVCENLEHIGIEINKEKNRMAQCFFNAASSRVKLLKIATDEELQMALHVKKGWGESKVLNVK